VVARGDLEIVLTRVFAAPRRLVFDAWTRPEHLVRWFGRRGDTLAVCEVDLRPGGTYRFVWRLREGGEMAVRGEYREVAPPERIVSTEVFEGAEFEVMGGGTLNTVSFEERGATTVMVCTVLYRSRAARDRALATPMEQGAGESYDRLAELLRALE
jgi:uncharacterized protein YndB with AHSA1/START domain